MVISTKDVLYLHKEEFAKQIHSVIKFIKIISSLLSSSSSSVALGGQSLSPTLCDPPQVQHASLLCPWGFPGKNTGVGCYSFLQGILLDQGLNPYLLHWQADSLPLSH